MKVVTAEQMRELDRKTIERFKTPGDVLMDRAGSGVAEIVRYVARAAGCSDGLMVVVAGRGNNGGDGFVAARALKEMDFEVEVWLAGDSSGVTGDARTHLSRMKSAGIKLYEFPTTQEWEDLDIASVSRGIVIDAILGTGTRGPARGIAAAAIRAVNALGERNLVVSTDIPSGLDADTGTAEGDTVVADVTAAIGLPKLGLVLPAAVDRVGFVDVVDIGIPDELLEPLAPDVELITGGDLAGLLPRRARSAHKGTFGHVLVVGGSAGLAGAPAMAARAAMRAGAGLVSVLAPPRIAPVVAGMVPEAMVFAGHGETAGGALTADALQRWRRDLREFDAIVVGPGLSVCDDTRRLVEGALHASRAPIVVDADAINALSGRTASLKGVSCPCLLTPHPGEMARLRGQGCTVDDVQADRFGMARRTAAETEALVVLKGAGTVVAAKGAPVRVNLTGNPGMASGGMGDVLAGCLAGLLAQRIAPADAAALGVFVHGRAGDLAAWHGSQAGLIADDVIEELPYALRDISVR